MTGWDSGGYYIDSVAMHNQNVLANGGNFVGPQQGPALPRDYYDEPGYFACGCSREDTDGIDCGHAEINFPAEVPPDPNLIPEDLVAGGER